MALHTDNPLHCACDSQELWQWLRDHPKWTRIEGRSQQHDGDTVGGAAFLRCDQPPELRGRIFGQLVPQQFCDQPLIRKVAIQDIQPYSVLVSWQVRDHTGLSGFRVLYQALDVDGGAAAAATVDGLFGAANGADGSNVSDEVIDFESEDYAEWSWVVLGARSDLPIDGCSINVMHWHFIMRSNFRARGTRELMGNDLFAAKRVCNGLGFTTPAVPAVPAVLL